MKIPIRNLYYMFLYAWARFPGGSLTDVGVDDCPDLPNLFAKLLASGTARLPRRGLDRGYQTYTEELVSPRGRLRLDRMIKENARLRGTAICDFDELSHDVLHNQILKATLFSLGRCRDVTRDTRHELLALSRRLQDVSDIRLSGGCFRRVTTFRHNRDYAFLMQLCEFVFWSLMPDERGAEGRFQQVLEDEARMSAVFEEFLRNFYQLHRADYTVGARSLAWDVSDATEDDLKFLPGMITDITLRSADRTLIIDAKYYKSALDHGPYGARVRSGHLYQLMTYLQHERRRVATTPLTGMLLYPEVGASLRLRYRLLGLPVIVATVNMGNEWPLISNELHQLLDDASFHPGDTLDRPVLVH